MKRTDKERVEEERRSQPRRGCWAISLQLGDTLCKLLGVIWKTAEERRSEMYLLAEEGL